MGNCAACKGKKKDKSTKDIDEAKGFFDGKKWKRKLSLEPSHCHHVENKADFTSQLEQAGEKLVVVYFYASWCGPCKMVRPKVEDIAELLKPGVIFLKVDVDQCEDLTSEYGISSMPTFVLIKSSEKLDEMTGVNMDKLQEIIFNHNK